MPPTALSIDKLSKSYVGAGHTVRVVDGLGEGIGRCSPFRGSDCLYGLPLDEIVERVVSDSSPLRATKRRTTSNVITGSSGLSVVVKN